MLQNRARRSLTGVAIAAASFAAVPAGAQLRPAQRTTLAHPVSNNGSKYTIADFLSPASPLEITVAKKADRIAWITYDQGVRNVFTAAAPDFKPVKITSFTGDNGIDLTYVQLSDDGRIATFIRGSAQNREGWVANPSHDPNGPDRAVWAARTDGTGAWRLANIENKEPSTGFRGRGGIPQVSPDGRFVVFSRDGQLYRARIARGVTASIDTGGTPFIEEWGEQGDPVWSPDGSKLAFVSTRDNHSLIMVYDMATRSVKYLSPSTDFDASPTWSPDGKRIAFIRRPGTPFGMQTQQGSGGIGNPAGPGTRGGRGAAGRGAARGGRFGQDTVAEPIDGLYHAAFPGGYTLSLMVADVATGDAHEFWHNQPNDAKFDNIRSIDWGSDRVIFTAQMPNDEWDRFFSISVDHPEAQPVLLTTTNGLINDGVDGRSFVTTALSPDGSTLYYCTNANDIEKRHIWAVPTAGGTPRQVSTDDGVEVSPEPLPSGKRLAVLYFNAKQPASVGLVPASGGSTKLIYPKLPASFPQAAHVVPQIVITHAADGLEIHNQLFLPADLKPGEKRPAIIFVHGGPSREMMPAYHYMQFYHMAYAFNQWLQTQGYIVMSINYRSGIGYGRSFQRAKNTEARGNSEYQDVLAGGRYLQSRPDVDPTRIGIWGLSYGGLLTAQALARNSDIFVAGVDLAGVHLYGSSLDSTNLAYQSSAAAHIDTWKSPVYLEQGDDDRNVSFAQTVGLVDLLRAHGIYYELTVYPDETHESLEHRRWLNTFNQSSDFLHRFVWERQTPPAIAAVGDKR